METNLSEKYMLERLVKILKNRLDINEEMFSGDFKKHKLLGPRFRLDSFQLVYLFFEVEKEFNIRISQDDICSGKFSTIENIIEIIKSNKYQLSA